MLSQSSDRELQSAAEVFFSKLCQNVTFTFQKLVRHETHGAEQWGGNRCNDQTTTYKIFKISVCFFVFDIVIDIVRASHP